MSIPTREEMYKALEERHGADIQKKLSAAKVAVCGLGGLGSNIAIALARAGVGKLHIIDFDTVKPEPSAILSRSAGSAKVTGAL